VYRLTITFVDKNVFLTRPGLYVALEDWVTNLLIFWSLALLLAVCRLWRRAHEQRRELERHCSRLQQLETWRDNLLHLIVHDMKTPLSGISTSLEYVRREAADKLSGPPRDCLDTAQEFCGDLLEMIRSLLDVSRLEAGALDLQPSPCVVAELMEAAARTVAPLARAKHLRINCAPGAVTVVCDRELVTRVLSNLLSNAVRFAPDGSEIRVTAETGPGVVTLAVSDEGPGVPAEFHQTIFEKFGRVAMQQSGRDFSTGLGLTFCKLVVEAHGGRIGVQSPPPGAAQGSRFWFTLRVS